MRREKTKERAQNSAHALLCCLGNKQNLTSDVLADTIMEVVMKPYDMPQENVKKMRDGILAALDFFKDYGKEDESKAAEESAS